MLIGVPKGPADIWTEVVQKEMSLIASFSHVYRDDYLHALELFEAESIRYEELIAERIDLAEAVDELAGVRTSTCSSGATKVLVAPSRTYPAPVR